MTNAEVRRMLSRYRAYEELSEWAENHGGLLQDLWRDCERGDWLLWLAAEAGVDRRAVVTAGCACARTALQYVPAGEERPRRAIELAEAWARGEETLETVRAAADAADAFDAVGNATAYAADAAREACDAAIYVASYAANAAANAAAAGFCANDNVEIARAEARARALAECADLVRAHISAADVDAAYEQREDVDAVDAQGEQ